jgi:hypothetical protein
MSGFKNAKQQRRSREHYSAPDSVDRAMSRSVAIPERSTFPPVAQWVFQKPSPESKTVSVSYESKPIEVTIEAVAPFDLSSFGETDSIRQTLTLRLPAMWGEMVECMEACLLDAVHREAPRFFEKDMTFAQVEEAYKSISKRTAEYPRNLRVKVNTRGLQATRYWDEAKNLVAAPEHHAGLAFSARVTLRGLWFVNNSWGLVCECSDLKVIEAEVVECPF